MVEVFALEKTTTANCVNLTGSLLGTAKSLVDTFLPQENVTTKLAGILDCLALIHLDRDRLPCFTQGPERAGRNLGKLIFD